ncbi:hypothetical protein GCM10009631_00170 [Corynebacterium glaucum]
MPFRVVAVSRPPAPLLSCPAAYPPTHATTHRAARFATYPLSQTRTMVPNPDSYTPLCLNQQT